MSRKVECNVIQERRSWFWFFFSRSLFAETGWWAGVPCGRTDERV